MDNLSNKLNKVNTRYIIGSMLISHLMYADDLVPEYRLEHDIKYNNAKSNVMIFCCKRIKDKYVLNFVLNGETLPRVIKCKYRGHIITEHFSDNVFKCYCTSLYTCQLWCYHRGEPIRKLCVAYNNVLLNRNELQYRSVS